MVAYTVKAELVTGVATLIQNGVSTDVSVDIPISFTTTQPTLREAKQKAREGVNLQASKILQDKLTAVFSSDTTILYKGRCAIEASLWMSVNVTNVVVVH